MQQFSIVGDAELLTRISVGRLLLGSIYFISQEVGDFVGPSLKFVYGASLEDAVHTSLGLVAFLGLLS